ncbi:phage minor capsid protein [Spiroplasma endosymbiont of Amphibalanus improvisus]|uniref:phage minor capsid protein n=1 Tax=Spiroplasma endosymbiont of Amphibalanus improvisus TaxID=3066327 RepID=UPI00313BA03C
MLNIDWWVYLVIAGVILIIILIMPFFNKKFRDKFTSNDKYKNAKPLKVKQDKKVIDTALISHEEYDNLTEAEQQAFQIYQHNLKLHNNNKEKFLGIYNGFGSKTSMRFEPTVIVLEKKDSCKLCRPYENKILSLYPTSKKYMTMQEAVNNGFHHLGCSHKELDYYPSDSLTNDNVYDDEEKDKNYNLKLKQFKYEDKIRNLKFQKNNLTNAEKIEDIKKQLLIIVEEYQLFLKENNLKRNLLREDYNIDFIEQFSS